MVILLQFSLRVEEREEVVNHQSSLGVTLWPTTTTTEMSRFVLWTSRLVVGRTQVVVGYEKRFKLRWLPLFYQSNKMMTIVVMMPMNSEKG